ncbi:adenine nucleotide transporter BT1, chloroplastic/mitochondrial [Selaginella moellendorffii]|uniref:adenine nucleotide transporter BT1, chloroplastic/mitochondrial n=1 Tax=Selaginella moellendorffii TaxID=88036 RepID=UPI000D1C4439|nr:adenine nucleotide transporter BT1, chloroplastic/mitochondrial [Selaginella moellendorffii]|eukprot:XP_024545371.1 adenine nucleotide transporter BT1, chloroplastic/mitochondrial [Selaginella moellendorffii]
MEDGDGDGAKSLGALVVAPDAPSPDFLLFDSSGEIRLQGERKRRRRRLGFVKSIARFVSRQLSNANRYVDPVLLVPSDRGGCRLHYSEIFHRKCLSCNAGPGLEFNGAAISVLSRCSAATSWNSGNVRLKSQELEKVSKLGDIDRSSSDGVSVSTTMVNSSLLDELVDDDQSRFSQLQEMSVSSSQVQSMPSSTQDLGVKLAENLSLKAVPNEPKSTNLKLGEELVAEEKRKSASCGKNHAVAGALAGVFVSLCLHPLDTVKTVIQSKNTGKQAILPIVASIVSTRGVSGLYRGLGSNLASSAPISAIYTFTYETMKAALLPRLPEEYHSLAHCAAGGCASIATSLVYTPSERVKQQMQIGAVYRNSWLAFVGILQRGGLPALYAGWEAVLCRNVPQSVIKFFTYEALKHRVLRDSPPDTHLTNLQTLACGGLAGSTAALFTTPFDVVKTRLQTQTIGSQHQYSSVLNALQMITRDEGIRSLYRGLIPRLAIYVSQGALFFASYEFFKRALAMEARSYQTPKSVSSDGSEASRRRRALLSAA